MVEKIKRLTLLQFGMVTIFIILSLVLIVVMARVLPPGVDWHRAFRPATLALLSGKSPYLVDGYFNAPWALIPLIPFAIFPEQLGRGALVLVSFAVMIYVAQRLKANRITTILLLLSPPFMHGVLNSNIDWLAALGFVLPPQIGLFFISIKPQMGIAVGVFWFWQAWQKGKAREVFRVFWPFTLMLLISFALYGLWPLRFEREVSLWWNASLWPASIPVGLALLVASLRKNKIQFAMGASPCLSPYVLLHSWVGALLAIVNSTPEMVAAFIGLWALFFMRL